MGKFSKFVLKGLAFAALLGFVGLHTAKADTILGGTASSCTTSTVACWTNITVSATDFGYPGTNVSTDTVEFFASPTSPSLSVWLFCTSGCGTSGSTANSASLYGPPAVFTGSTTAPDISSTAVIPFTNTLDKVNDGGAGNSGSDPGDNFNLVSLGLGNFDINSASINLTFTLPTGSTPPPSVPEPSSLLMLGSGLLGLMGFGLRRQGIV